MLVKVTDRDHLKNLIDDEDEISGGDFLYELHYESEGNIVEFNEVQLPENWKIKVVEVNDDFDYNSYGYRSAENAYIILEVEDYCTNETALYKIPGTYASFEGWSWNTSDLKRVEKREVLVKNWVWSEV